MRPILQGVGRWLRRRAENVAAALLGIMFVAFIVQIVFRYLFNFPIGWTTELTLITWLWLVLWGAGLVLREDEEIRFDIVFGAVGRRIRRAMIAGTAAALVALYLISLPAVVDYVTFMEVQDTTYLELRFDYLYSIYVIFAVAAIVRYCWLGWRAVRGDGREAPDASKAGSGL